VLLPYVIGGGSPIPYLFEGILPHINNRFYFRVFATDNISLPENVSAVRVSNQGKFRKAFRYGLTALESHDLIHTGAIYWQRHVARLAKLRNPDIARMHSIRVDVDPEGKYDTDIYHMLSKKADITTAVSEHTAKTVREHFGIDPVVIYNGVDTEWFNPDYDRPAILDELGVNDPTFLFVGSLEKRKRPSHVLDIAAAVPEATFLLVGDGSLADTLQDRASELDNVVLPGRLPKAKLPAVYANVRGFVFPTVREGCPNVVLEAMAAGLPTVGYRATSMPELIEHGERGLLASTDDIDGLISCVNRLLDSDEAEAMGTNARAYVQENHTFDKIATQYESLYTELLE